MGNLSEYTYDMFCNAINELALQINRSGINYTHIIGLTRGGLVPAVTLSHKLDIPMLAANWPSVPADREVSEELKAVFADPKNQILVVDDILDSGRTVDAFIEQYGQADIATLIWNIEQHITPKYYAKIIHRSEVPDWFVFWWEKV